MEKKENQVAKKMPLSSQQETVGFMNADYVLLMQSK